MDFDGGRSEDGRLPGAHVVVRSLPFDVSGEVGRGYRIPSRITCAVRIAFVIDGGLHDVAPAMALHQDGDVISIAVAVDQHL